MSASFNKEQKASRKDEEVRGEIVAHATCARLEVRSEEK